MNTPQAGGQQTQSTGRGDWPTVQRIRGTGWGRAGMQSGRV